MYLQNIIKLTNSIKGRQILTCKNRLRVTSMALHKEANHSRRNQKVMISFNRCPTLTIRVDIVILIILLSKYRSIYRQEDLAHRKTTVSCREQFRGWRAAIVQSPNRPKACPTSSLNHLIFNQ